MRLFDHATGLLGIDITSATVKLLELRRKSDAMQVESYAVRPLKDGAVVERRIKDIEGVADVLKQAVDHARPTTRRAAVAVPASATITKVLRLPASLNEEEIEERIVNESERHIPFPFNEVAFDFHPLGMAPDDTSEQEVMLVACRLQDVDQLSETVERAGLEAVMVDVEVFAVERAFAQLRRHLAADLDDSESVGLVDVGANMNALHIIRHGNTVYSRDAVFGGRQLTDAIRQRYGLSMNEAGYAKKRGGLPEDYEPKVLNPFLETLVSHVGRSLQLYYTSGRHEEIRHLVLAGGTSAIPGLAERIAADSGMRVTLANPFLGMRVHSRLNPDTLRNDAPAMLTATGLAMRVGR